MKHWKFAIIALLAIICTTRAIFVAKGNWHRQSIAVSNRQFKQTVETVKNLPPDSCGRYHIREVTPPSLSSKEPLLVVSVQDASGRKTFTSESPDEMLRWLADETKACGAKTMVLLN
jgi:hypothetical protein